MPDRQLSPDSERLEDPYHLTLTSCFCIIQMQNKSSRINSMVLNNDTVRFCVGIEDKKDKKDHTISTLGCGRILSVFCLIFATLCGLLSFAERVFLYIALFLVALFLLTFILTYMQIRLQKKVKALDFFLEMDTCTGKYTDPGDSDSMPTQYLYFAKYGKKGLNAPFSSVFLRPSYEDTEIGDEFYFLYVGKKVVNMFNKRSWTLDTSQFVERDGRFYPVK